MRQFLFSFIFSFLFIQASVAQTFEVNVSSDSILIGNYVELRFKCDEVNGKFEAPEFVNLDVISGPNVSMSTQYINGEYAGSKEISFHIRPTAEGQIVIPPAYYIIDEKTIETLPLTLNVYPNPEGIIQRPEQKSNNFFFESFDFPFSHKEEKKEKKTKKKLKRL